MRAGPGRAAMKITCQSCQAKYTIADEKVAGKTVKIKCKKCGATIVVHGSDAAAQAPQDPGSSSANGYGGENSSDDDGETRVFGAGGGSASTDEWTVNITDDDQRTMTTTQLLVEYQRGL